AVGRGARALTPYVRAAASARDRGGATWNAPGAGAAKLAWQRRSRNGRWIAVSAACFPALFARYRAREVGGGRTTRQPGQVRKEAALTSTDRVARQPPTISRETR